MIRTAYDQGRFAALARLGLKTAGELPAARIVPRGSGVRTPATMPEVPGAATLPQLPHPAIAAARALPGQMGRAMRPMGRMLGLGALGAGAALAYGMHRQNVQDRENYPLVYAPMQGTVMG